VLLISGYGDFPFLFYSFKGKVEVVVKDREFVVAGRMTIVPILWFRQLDKPLELIRQVRDNSEPEEWPS